MKDSNKVIRAYKVKFHIINLFSLNINAILDFS